MPQVHVSVALPIPVGAFVSLQPHTLAAVQ